MEQIYKHLLNKKKKYNIKKNNNQTVQKEFNNN